MDDTSEEISTKLVEKARAMLRKPSINTDVIGLLNECWRKVEQKGVYLRNGICNINFAEVGIVLEICSIIYGKKVSLLLDNLLNYEKDLAKFDIEGKKTKGEENTAEKRLEKLKRTRKKKPQSVLSKKTLKINLRVLAAQLNVRLDYKEELTLKHVVRSYFSNFPKDVELDPIERYLRPLFITTDYALSFADEDICSNNQILTHNLQFEASEYIRQLQHNVLGDRDVRGVGFDLEEEVMHKFLMEKKISFAEMTDSYYKELYDRIEKDMDERSSLRKKCRRLCPRRSSIHLTRLSVDVVNQYLKKDRNNVDDSVPSTSSQSRDSGILDDSVASTSHLSKDSGILDDSAASTSHLFTDSGIMDCEPSEEISIEGENSENITAVDNNNITEADNSQNVTPTVCDNITQINIENNDQSTSENDNRDTENEQNISKEDSNKCEKNKKSTKVDDKTIKTPERTSKREKRKSKKPLDEYFVNLDDEEEKAASAKRIKVSEEFICRKIVTRLLKDFELFFYKNYKPQEGEGALVEPIYPEETIEETCEMTTINQTQDSGICADMSFESDDANDTTPDLSDMMNVTTSIEINNEVLNETNNEVVNETNNEIVNETNNEVVNETNNEVVNETNNEANKEKLKKANLQLLMFLETMEKERAAMGKYLEWKNYIQKKFAESEKKDFDIHEYETQILDTLPDNEEVPLNKVMSGKKPSQVARLFAASLQLTNTSNIQLSNIFPAKLANDTLKIRVLSRERQHEQLETYEAPSVENRKIVMKRIRDMQDAQVAHSSTMHSDHIPQKKRCKR